MIDEGDRKKTAFCTIVTADYLPFAKTLFKSLRKFDSNILAFVLIVDSPTSGSLDDLIPVTLEELQDVPLSQEIIRRYRKNPNALRWSLKSILLIHLLKTSKFEQVFFVDPDLYFYSDFKFLYEELCDHAFLLSPHWGCMHPKKSEVYFQRLMTDGLYNAGFLGATAKGLPTLQWWADSCLRACERDKSRGLHDDQGYLNLFPILSPDTKILNHRGCNVAEWNRFEVSRSFDEHGNLILDEIYPLVFIHFSNLGYLVEHDPLLVPFLQAYEKELRKNGFTRSLMEPAQGFVRRNRLKNLTFLERVVRKLVGERKFSIIKGWNID